MSKVKTALFFTLQFIWGAPQSILGTVLLLRYLKCSKRFFHGALLVLHSGKFGGVSLGPFIFVNKQFGQDTDKISVHEYGHSIQSILLGPFYLLFIGIFSAVWCNAKRFKILREQKGVSYYSFFTESWANSLGERFTKQKAPEAL